MINKKIIPLKRNGLIFTALLLFSLTGCQSLGQYEPVDYTQPTLNKEVNNSITIETIEEEKIKKITIVDEQITIDAVRQAVKNAIKEAVKEIKKESVKNAQVNNKVVAVTKVANIDDKIIIGAVEKIELPTYKIIFNARIDTGATTTSINAQNIKKFERDGKKWVRFEINNKKGKVITLEKPVNKMVRIKRHDADNQRRYVVELTLKLDQINFVSKVTLSDRSNFDYPLLIGRNVLTDIAIVDVSKEFTIQ